MSLSIRFFFFFFNDTATTEIYTLSLHDALPISNEFFGGGVKKIGCGGQHFNRSSRRHTIICGRDATCRVQSTAQAPSLLQPQCYALLIDGSVNGAVAGSPQQAGFFVDDRAHWNGFEQRLHASFTDERLHEQRPGKLEQNFRRDSSRQKNAASRQNF